MTPRSQISTKSFLIGWAVLAALLVAPILALQIDYMRRLERIRENPATAIGVFTAKNCAMHASRFYEFRVEGKSYRDGGSSEAGGDCEAVRIGAPINVRYERNDPANNTGGDPAAELWNEIIAMTLIALIIPPFIISRFGRWRARGYPVYWNGK